MEHEPKMHEDIGSLKADVRTLVSQVSIMAEKVDILSSDMSMLKTRVAVIAGGIGSFVTLAGTYVWDKLTGKHPS